MKKTILVSADRGETRVAVLESKTKGGKRNVAELYIERRGRRSIVGNIYKGKVDNVLPGMEAAFVDIGLERNGFLHVDEIVLPSGEQAPRRGRGSGRRIDELIKSGQEIVVQVVKDPLKSKGARLSMNVSIAGRYLVYAPQGSGVGVSRRLAESERDRLRKMVDRTYKGPGGLIVRTAAHGAKKVRLRARDRLPAQAERGARAAHRADQGPGARLPGGRPAGAGPARRLPQRLRNGDHRLPEAVRTGDRLLPAHRAGAGRGGRALRGPKPLFEKWEIDKEIESTLVPAGRPALGRLPDHRLRRGADGDRRQQRQLHRPRQRRARGDDHPGQHRGRRGGGAPAAAARHRRDHRHRLHRHGAGEKPRQSAENAAQSARRRQVEELRGRGLAARAGRDDAPERHRRRARDPHRALPDLRRRGRRPLGRDGRARGPAQDARDRRRETEPRRSCCGSTRRWRPS